MDVPSSSHILIDVLTALSSLQDSDGAMSRYESPCIQPSLQEVNQEVAAVRELCFSASGPYHEDSSGKG
jgi:hypothetical protein